VLYFRKEVPGDPIDSEIVILDTLNTNYRTYILPKPSLTSQTYLGGVENNFIAERSLIPMDLTRKAFVMLKTEAPGNEIKRVLKRIEMNDNLGQSNLASWNVFDYFETESAMKLLGDPQTI
jgi:hypothetical protein